MDLHRSELSWHGENESTSGKMKSFAIELLQLLFALQYMSVLLSDVSCESWDAICNGMIDGGLVVLRQCSG
jgi:hypothetical protein